MEWTPDQDPFSCDASPTCPLRHREWFLPGCCPHDIVIWLPPQWGSPWRRLGVYTSRPHPSTVLYGIQGDGKDVDIAVITSMDWNAGTETGNDQRPFLHPGAHKAHEKQNESAVHNIGMETSTECIPLQSTGDVIHWIPALLAIPWRCSNRAWFAEWSTDRPDTNPTGSCLAFSRGASVHYRVIERFRTPTPSPGPPGRRKKKVQESTKGWHARSKKKNPVYFARNGNYMDGGL